MAKRTSQFYNCFGRWRTDVDCLHPTRLSLYDKFFWIRRDIATVPSTASSLLGPILEHCARFYLLHIGMTVRRPLTGEFVGIGCVVNESSHVPLIPSSPLGADLYQQAQRSTVVDTMIMPTTLIDL
ncbi:hypothetical protein EVAR_60442_1 [Eumeta japonica]|uniref:Uncharacterized protein n=1 Tax=Eumeta variegata TaxID=151549 RepID=A0A4C1Z2I3_EUMVA|nr:hypothetical protein EVAR_60442_1 [Eumeta japonica]